MAGILSVENGSERYILGDHATTLDAGTYRMLLEDACWQDRALRR